MGENLPEGRTQAAADPGIGILSYAMKGLDVQQGKSFKGAATIGDDKHFELRREKLLEGWSEHRMVDCMPMTHADRNGEPSSNCGRKSRAQGLTKIDVHLDHPSVETHA